MKKKVVFISFFGSQNIGDNLIVNSLSDLINSDFEIEKFNYSLINDREICTNDTVTVEKKNILKKIYKNNLRNFVFFDYLHKLKNNRKIKKNINLNRFEKELKKSDILIIGGGNTFFDLTKCSDSYLRSSLIMDMAIKYNKPIFFMSIGIGPFQTKRQMKNVFNTLSKANYITFRDKRYLKYLTDVGMENDNFFQSIDPVFLLDNKKNFAVKNSYNKIGICIIDYRLNKATDKEYDDYIEDMINIIKKLINYDFEIFLYSSAKEDCFSVMEVYSYFEKNKKVELINIRSSEHLIEFYSNLDLVLGARMHALIVAVSQYIPVIGISWQPKVEEMFKLLNQNNSVFEIKNLKLENKKIINSILDKKNNYIVERNKLVDFKVKSEKLFKINKEILSELNEI